MKDVAEIKCVFERQQPAERDVAGPRPYGQYRQVSAERVAQLQFGSDDPGGRRGRRHDGDQVRALQSFASELNPPGGVSVSPYVQQIADDVIDGNSANATWNGGASTATTLGNLSATSTPDPGRRADRRVVPRDQPAEPQCRRDRRGEPQSDVPDLDAAALRPERGPTYHDVNQGYLGDCYFSRRSARSRCKDPAAIENMITSNGNGTYCVRFYRQRAGRTM